FRVVVAVVVVVEAGFGVVLLALEAVGGFGAGPGRATPQVGGCGGGDLAGGGADELSWGALEVGDDGAELVVGGLGEGGVGGGVVSPTLGSGVFGRSGGLFGGVDAVPGEADGFGRWSVLAGSITRAGVAV